MARQQTIPLHEPPSAGRAFAATALDAEGPAIDQPVAATDSLVGQRIDHFQIHELLGEGGMGAVYLAHDMSLERRVAIKVLRRELASDERLVGRLVMEAQAQACLQHPSVVTIYYIGNFKGAPYFAMEHVPGGTLAEYIQKEGPLPWGEALEYIIQTTRALAAAHGRCMVHRDIKPSNLLLGAIPAGAQAHAIKVADFGVAAHRRRRWRLRGHALLCGARADRGRRAQHARRRVRAGHNLPRAPHRPRAVSGR